MNLIESVVLPKDFSKFLPGFRAAEFFTVILIAVLILSRHPSLNFMPALIGGLIGIYAMPRLFLFAAKKGLLGENWDKDGLRNNPYI